jgi:hypothetical protein
MQDIRFHLVAEADSGTGVDTGSGGRGGAPRGGGGGGGTLGGGGGTLGGGGMVLTSAGANTRFLFDRTLEEAFARRALGAVGGALIVCRTGLEGKIA